MKPDLLHILQHSLGLDQYGDGLQFRNHFVAGGDNIARCRELVAGGYMEEGGSNALTGGMPCFFVTSAGIGAVALHSPDRPKLSRSQQRYRDYLKLADCYESFSDFLRRKSVTPIDQ